MIDTNFTLSSYIYTSSHSRNWKIHSYMIDPNIYPKLSRTDLFQHQKYLNIKKYFNVINSFCGIMNLIFSYNNTDA